jgi:tripartite-type tricarboxylate transporter receptor subunit TctC
MIRSIFRRLALAFCAGALLAPFVTAQAQPFPSKSITLIVPWPAGGSTDRHSARSPKLPVRIRSDRRHRKQPGAGGTLGPSTMALTAKPTVTRSPSTPLGMVRYPHMQKVNWHLINDFTFIIGISGYTFVVRADSPYKSFMTTSRRHASNRARSTSVPPAQEPARTC